MRKGLIATAVAVVLFAVGALAASFPNVFSDQVTAGSDRVEACAENVRITFNEPTFASADGVWVTDGATADFYNDGPEATVCDGGTARLALRVGSTFDQVGDEADVTDDSATFSFDEVDVEEIDEASVAVNGVWIGGD